jgi:hypothetical protein
LNLQNNFLTFMELTSHMKIMDIRATNRNGNPTIRPWNV